eukprot:SAG11_NODE_3628_length_2326_cov_3.714414_3_plen_167_part_01
MDFNLDNALRDLTSLGLLEHITDVTEAAEALRKNAEGGDDADERVLQPRIEHRSSLYHVSFRAQRSSSSSICHTGSKLYGSERPFCVLDLLNQSSLDALLQPTPAPVKVPGLLEYEAQTGAFSFTLVDEGVPYGELDSRRLVAALRLTIPPPGAAAGGAAARFSGLS